MEVKNRVEYFNALYREYPITAIVCLLAVVGFINAVYQGYFGFIYLVGILFVSLFALFSMFHALREMRLSVLTCSMCLVLIAVVADRSAVTNFSDRIVATEKHISVSQEVGTSIFGSPIVYVMTDSEVFETGELVIPEGKSFSVTEYESRDGLIGYKELCYQDKCVNL